MLRQVVSFHHHHHHHPTSAVTSIQRVQSFVASTTSSSSCFFSSSSSSSSRTHRSQQHQFPFLLPTTRAARRFCASNSKQQKVQTKPDSKWTPDTIVLETLFANLFCMNCILLILDLNSMGVGIDVLSLGTAAVSCTFASYGIAKRWRFTETQEKELQALARTNELPKGFIPFTNIGKTACMHRLLYATVSGALICYDGNFRIVDHVILALINTAAHYFSHCLTKLMADKYAAEDLTKLTPEQRVEQRENQEAAFQNDLGAFLLLLFYFVCSFLCLNMLIQKNAEV